MLFLHSFPRQTPLVLASSLLTRLQLIQIPPTNRQVSLVLIHTCSEAVDIVRASTLRLVGLRGTALDETVVLLGLERSGLLSSGLGAAATEPAADCVADGGSDCYTTVWKKYC